MIKTKPPPGLGSLYTDQIIQCVMNYRASKILLVAVWYDLFSIIHQGHNQIEDICRLSKTDIRATSILLNALVSMGFLSKLGEVYHTTSSSEECLVRGKPHYLGNNLRYQELLWDTWSELKFVLKAGKPRKNLEEWLLTNPTFGPDYIQGMNNISKRPAQELASLLPINDIQTLLDVGAGAGTYSQEFLNKNSKLHATLLDLAPTLKITRELDGWQSIKDRAHFIEGNYHHWNFGKNQFDLVLMSHITHDEGEQENKNLMNKAFASLRPGGKLVIHDFVINESHTNPLFSTLFSVHMLVYTEKGNVYSLTEYENWLKEAGFVDVENHTINKDSKNASRVILATHPRT